MIRLKYKLCSLACLVVLPLPGCDTSPKQAAPREPTKTNTALPANHFERQLQHGEAKWLLFDLDPARVTLMLVGQRADEPQTFEALAPYLKERGLTLAVATNAGIFGPARQPMGLHVQDGEILTPLSTADGDGNFFLKPNGVFWLDDAGVHVASSEHYAPQGRLRLATQSGPLLLEHGQIHPGFSPESRSLRLRSAVGVDARGHAHLAISLGQVSFYNAATLFRDVIGCPDALYLDGEISEVMAPRHLPTKAHAYAALLVATWR
ncbi:MAG TPA: phosphodiester glycosidase family protein [Polyangiaceae bacterium]|nr:phosphodiester glycosidase family protein [Polyangiaceae bacterium]